MESKSSSVVEVSEDHNTDAFIPPAELGESSSGDSKVEICDVDGGARPDFAANELDGMEVEPKTLPKTLSQMIADANEIEKRFRASPPSSERKLTVAKRNSWQGSLVKSFTGIFP